MGNNAANSGVVDKDIEAVPARHSLPHEPHSIGIGSQISLNVNSLSQFNG
jgi:hypothetical protein